jgi:hypothetical protein
VESDQPHHRSRHLLQLPPNFDSFHSKRRRVIRCGTHKSTVQTCESIKMSIEPNIQSTGSSLTPIPTIVNDSPSAPATTSVATSKAPIITIGRSFEKLPSEPNGEPSLINACLLG